TQRPFLHSAGAYPQVNKYLTQLLHVKSRLLGVADFRLADDLHQGHPRTVEVHQRVGLAALVAMDQRPSAFFEVDACDADATFLSIPADSNVAMPTERLVVLRDLIALGEVGVAIVLAIELGELGDLAV